LGGTTTEIAVIALDIVCDKICKIAGDVLQTTSYITCITQHNLFVGETTAEKIKIQIGAATEDLETPPEDMSVTYWKTKQVDVSFKLPTLDKSFNVRCCNGNFISNTIN
jgi:rod shape-determining protein MreB